MHRHERKQGRSLRPGALSMALALLAAQAALSLPAHAQTVYDLTPIGSLSGGTTRATAINSSGDVVGCSLAVINGASVGRAFLYSNGQLVDLGSLASDGRSCAEDINDLGQITGSSATPTGEERGFIYQNGVMTSLGDAGSSSTGESINNAGLVAGYAYDLNGSYQGGFIYNGQLSPPQLDIGTLNGGDITQPRSINANGDIAGWAVNAEFRGTSFLYQNGVMIDLGLILGFPSQAMSLNDLGQVVGTTSGGGFVYDAGTVTELPSLGGNGSSPVSINNAGQIVGSSWTPEGTHAFVITDGQIVDLNDAIVATDPDAQFVTLRGATDINENGWIVANGVDSRTGWVQGAWLLRPVASP